MSPGRSEQQRTCLHVIFRGHVQGVGFRYTCQNLAAGRPIGGFVRNLPDGTVELEADGAVEDVRALLAEIDAHLGSHIRSRQVHERPSTGAEPPLRIAY